MSNIKQMIKQAMLNLLVDSGPYPRGQASYNGKTTDFLHCSPYGLESVPPPNSWVLLLSSQSQESVKIGLIADFLNRKKNKLPGEVVLHNTLTGSNIFLKANGDINITAIGDNNLSVTGNVNMNVIGDINLTSTGSVNLGGPGGAAVAKVGDSVVGGVITTGSSKVKAVA